MLRSIHIHVQYFKSVDCTDILKITRYVFKYILPLNSIFCTFPCYEVRIQHIFCCVEVKISADIFEIPSRQEKEVEKKQHYDVETLLSVYER